MIWSYFQCSLRGITLLNRPYCFYEVHRTARRNNIWNRLCLWGWTVGREFRNWACCWVDLQYFYVRIYMHCAVFSDCTPFKLWHGSYTGRPHSIQEPTSTICQTQQNSWCTSYALTCTQNRKASITFASLKYFIYIHTYMHTVATCSKNFPVAQNDISPEIAIIMAIL